MPYKGVAAMEMGVIATAATVAEGDSSAGVAVKVIIAIMGALAFEYILLGRTAA